MNRQQAKELLPIVQAFVEGKTIEFRTNSISKWIETTTPKFDLLHEYRIKPEPKYRPFRNKEECWNEMLKHQPFGWVKHTSSNEYFYSILEVVDGGCVFVYGPMVPFDEAYEFNTFADGTPFGIKE